MRETTPEAGPGPPTPRHARPNLPKHRPLGGGGEWAAGNGRDRVPCLVGRRFVDVVILYGCILVNSIYRF